MTAPGAASPSLRTVRAVVTSLLLLTTACSDGPVSPIASEQNANLVRGESGKPVCAPDDKLIGRIELSADDRPGTWWYITREGFDDAGIVDHLGFLESTFGQSFGGLDAGVQFLVEQVIPRDQNDNGYVCAYRTRGKHTAIGDPNLAYYLFAVRDDRE